MKKITLITLSAIAILSCSLITPYETATLSRNENFTLFSLASIDSPSNILFINYGQSNAAKFQSVTVNSSERVNEWSASLHNFTRSIRYASLELKHAYPNSNIYWVNYTNGGSNMDRIGLGGADYLALKTRLDEAMDTLNARSISIDLVIFNFMQGEADCRKYTLANAYQTREKQLLDSLISEYNINKVVSNQVFKCIPIATYPFRSTVRNAKISNSVNYLSLIEIPYQYYESDSIHLNQNGVKEYVRIMLDSIANN